MKSRRLAWILAALFLLTTWMGTLVAQDQSDAPPQDMTAQGDAQQNGPPPGAYDNNAPPDYNNAPGPNGPNDAQEQQVQDPSGRVARVQYMSGEVSMQPGGVNDWVAASMNRPLTTADRVWTDKDSRAELNVGDGFLRMSSETSVTLTNVADNTVQIELDQGVLEITVRHLMPGEIYEVDTPNVAFTLMKSGVYRIDVDPNGDQTLVTVRSGQGEATGKGAAVKVKSGEQVRFTAGNSLTHTVQAAPPRDGFDDWAQVRDKRLENSVSAQYVSPGVIGYQDLDNNGTWQTSPQYGAVWVPSVAPGWAPYRYGHWAWIAPWGWTWVDDASWGFAPFHYGRWVDWNGGWGWAPGPLGYWNPYYAPALVGWIGGPGFGIGFGFGGGWGLGINFGWFPLGWGEPFYPRYCGWGRGGWGWGRPGWRGGYVSNTYVRNVNITNTHINNINSVTNNYRSNNLSATHYAFQNKAGAVTAAPKSAFTSGAAINKVGAVVPKSALGSAKLVSTANVAPTKQSVLGGHTPLTTHGVPPASATNRNVVTHATPPAVSSRLSGAQAAASRPNATPAAQGNHNAAGAAQGNAAHNVNRPPTAGGAANNANNQVAHSTTPSNPAAHNVPRPPANYTYRPSTGNPQASHQAAPAQHAAPQGNSHSGSQGGNSGAQHGSGMASSRPPAGYAYHAAPAYSPSSRYGAAGPSYSTANRGSSGYGAGRSYGASPTYSTRSSAPSYSAPRSYGGGGHASGGGGGHASGGGGGHGGGGHR